MDWYLSPFNKGHNCGGVISFVFNGFNIKLDNDFTLLDCVALDFVFGEIFTLEIDCIDTDVESSVHHRLHFLNLSRVPVGNKETIVPLNGATTFPSVGLIAILLPSTSLLNVLSFTSEILIWLPMTGVLIASLIGF